MAYLVRELEEIVQLQVLVPYLLGHNGFIAGGCFKNILNGEKPKDIDIFFKSETDFTAADILFKDNKKYKPYYSNNKVETYKNKTTGIVVELIKWKFGTPEKIISDFDFTITKMALFTDVEGAPDGEGIVLRSKIIHHDKFFEHLHFKRLVADDKFLFPVSSFECIIKYSKYGYYPCRETKIKLLKAIRQMDGEFDVANSLYDGVD